MSSVTRHSTRVGESEAGPRPTGGGETTQLPRGRPRDAARALWIVITDLSPMYLTIRPRKRAAIAAFDDLYGRSGTFARLREEGRARVARCTLTIDSTR